MANLSNNQIEKLAVHAIDTESVKKDSFLTTNISVGDKAPSFDGSITLFKDASGTKESYINEIPVQIKGTLTDHFSESTRSFRLEMDHYNNFYKRGGCLLLVVEILQNHTTKIFYAQLLVIELREILDTYGDQKSYSIQLRALEETSLYNVCCIFSDQMLRQNRILLETHQYADSEFNSIKFTSPTYNLSNFGLMEIFKHKFFQYGVKDNIEIPLRTVHLESISLPRKEIVEIIDGEIETFIEITVDKAQLIKLCVEKTLVIEINTLKNTFTMDTSNVQSIHSQIVILEILKKIFISRRIKFQGLALEIGDESFVMELEKLNQELTFWLNAKEIFTLLKINLKTDFKKSETIYGDIERLNQMILLKNYEGIVMENPENPSFFRYHVGGLYVVLFYDPNSELQFINPFSKEFIETSSIAIEIKSSKEIVNISPFLLLENETLRDAINIDFELINESYKLIELEKIHLIFDIINEFCLRCIKTYDENKNIELLESSFSLLSYIENSDNISSFKNIIFVNKMQIVLRINKSYSREEKSNIIKLKIETMKNKDHDLGLLFCLNTLLGNFEEAKYNFDLFDDDTKKQYSSLPIFNIYMNL